jgi:hemolysin III
MPTNYFSIREEIVNAVTHGVGACLSVAALVVLVVTGALHGTAWHVVSYAIFGACMVILYTSSTIYHGLTNLKAKVLFQKFDHISIFLVIAGSYTPFCLVTLRGWIGWTLFGVIWGCAVAGIVFKSFYIGKWELLSTLLYILMGWMCLIAIKPLYDLLPQQAFLLLIGGGIAYTIGAVFFTLDRIPYFHGIWHLFTIAGSTSHFFAVLCLTNG